ncbi:MAG: S-layer homology domain-containing protein, partial [Anaerotignum sp.]|nr:S-layer homology domain-containing protein [Anaerotignum sp.]
MKRKSKNSGRAISMALAASMLVAPVNVVLAASTDIQGHWAEKTITEWQDKGLISGYQDGTFQPNRPTTRAEFARIMNQALGLNSKGTVAFSDVSVSDWFYNDVAIALGEAYTAGYPDGTFKPNETITRAQAAVFIANAIGASGGSVAAFTDSAAIPAWAKDSVGAIVEKGYMSGYPDGTFNPNAVLTRAEAVSTLNRIMGAATDEKETPVSDEDVVIDKDDTKLENQTIEGNLTISEKVGDGEVYLKNVEIKGDLIIQGGGDDSIYVEDTTVEGKTVLDRKNVRLQVSGKTNLSKVEIKKACNFNASNFTGEVGTITITGAISDQTTIGVPADKLYVDGKANLLLKKVIGEVVVDEDAGGSKLELDKAAKVS